MMQQRTFATIIRTVHFEFSTKRKSVSDGKSERLKFSLDCNIRSSCRSCFLDLNLELEYLRRHCQECHRRVGQNPAVFVKRFGKFPSKCFGKQFLHLSSLRRTFRWSLNYSSRHKIGPLPSAQPSDAADLICFRRAWWQCCCPRGRAALLASVQHFHKWCVWRYRRRAERRQRLCSKRPWSLCISLDQPCPRFGLWSFCLRPLQI